MFIKASDESKFDASGSEPTAATADEILPEQPLELPEVKQTNVDTRNAAGAEDGSNKETISTPKHQKEVESAADGPSLSG